MRANGVLDCAPRAFARPPTGKKYGEIALLEKLMPSIMPRPQGLARVWPSRFEIDILTQVVAPHGKWTHPPLRHDLEGLPEPASAAADNCTHQLRPGSSVVERGPEKAGVGGSIPSLATIPFERIKFGGRARALERRSVVLPAAPAKGRRRRFRCIFPHLRSKSTRIALAVQVTCFRLRKMCRSLARRDRHSPKSPALRRTRSCCAPASVLLLRPSPGVAPYPALLSKKMR